MNMYGIAGFVAVAPDHGTSKVLQRMTEAIRHRGPDDNGLYHDEYAHLEHRRLGIVDVAGGHQPLSNQAGNLWIIYNGEVFNHSEPRVRLEIASYSYVTRCLFSFAIWDKNARSLSCARDQLGIKPFYYFWESLYGMPGATASYIGLAGLHLMIDRYRSGVEDATDRIWSLLNLQVRGAKFLTGKRDRWRDGLLTSAVARSAV